MSELKAVSGDKELCISHNKRVVFCPDPVFIPKVNSPFHRSEKLVLPFFFHGPKHPQEKEWHCLDVKRTVSFYLGRPFVRLMLCLYLSRRLHLDTASPQLPSVGGLEAGILLSYKSTHLDHALWHIPSEGWLPLQPTEHSLH